jgi:hypothetical protein
MNLKTEHKHSTMLAVPGMRISVYINKEIK